MNNIFYIKETEKKSDKELIEKSLNGDKLSLEILI